MTDIAKLRALLTKASPRPWRASNGKGVGSVVANDCAIYLTVRTVETDETVERWHADATLIADAVNTLPELLDAYEACSCTSGIDTNEQIAKSLLATWDANNIEYEKLYRSAKEQLAQAHYWLLRAYQSGHREGWEDGPSVKETMERMHDHLCNIGLDPNQAAARAFLDGTSASDGEETP